MDIDKLKFIYCDSANLQIMIKKNKKSAENVIWTVVVIALLLLFLLIYTGVWKNLFGKGISGINEQFDSAGDADNDGVINIADKCPCPPKGVGSIENNGCPSGYKITGEKKDTEDRSCLQKKK